MSDFHAMTENLINEIKNLMDNRDSCPGYMTETQLESIKQELYEMDKIRDKNVFYPYYPKGIADCWDFKDNLAIQLMKHLEIYCSL
jgi:hypothetical protein